MMLFSIDKEHDHLGWLPFWVDVPAKFSKMRKFVEIKTKFSKSAVIKAAEKHSKGLVKVLLGDGGAFTWLLDGVLQWHVDTTILLNKYGMAFDLCNRYSAVVNCSTPDGEGVEYSMGHVWGSGSPRVQVAGPAPTFNPNTGEVYNCGDDEGWYKVDVLIPIDFEDHNTEFSHLVQKYGKQLHRAALEYVEREREAVKSMPWGGYIADEPTKAYSIIISRGYGKYKEELYVVPGSVSVVGSELEFDERGWGYTQGYVDIKFRQVFDKETREPVDFEGTARIRVSDTLFRRFTTNVVSGFFGDTELLLGIGSHLVPSVVYDEVKLSKDKAEEYFKAYVEALKWTLNWVGWRGDMLDTHHEFIKDSFSIKGRFGVKRYRHGNVYAALFTDGKLRLYTAKEIMEDVSNHIRYNRPLNVAKVF